MKTERKKELKNQVLARLDLAHDTKDEEIFDCINQVIMEAGKEEYIPLKEKSQLRQEIFNSLRRLDVLQELVEDRTITEIIINGANHIFIEENGAIRQWEKQFESKEKLEDVVQQIVTSKNRIVNETSPIVDVRLDDGSRVNVVLPPVALNGPIVTIRKFPENPITMEKLIAIGSITREAAEFLKKCIVARYNIFISGGTGSGKTTFLNALSNYIPRDERIITIEDSAELQIKNIPNLVRLEARNKNQEGHNEISIRDLIKSSLRMRPDRIVVGEVRDAAAIDMLAAMGTGHDGSMSTGHANHPRDMLARLETLVLMGMDIPLMAVRRQIASSIDLVVHLGRLRDKTRKVLSIVEVLDIKEGEITVEPLYEFQETGEKDGRVEGELKRTNHEFVQDEKMRRAGIVL